MPVWKGKEKGLEIEAIGHGRSQVDSYKAWQMRLGRPTHFANPRSRCAGVRRSHQVSVHHGHSLCQPRNGLWVPSPPEVVRCRGHRQGKRGL